jgi:cytidylate kinase
MIRVVSVGREYGSGGAGIARRLADRLGWKLVDRSLIDEIAKAAKVSPALAEYYDERVDPWFHRLGKGLWCGGYEGVTAMVDVDIFDADAMAELSGRVIEGAASIGNCVVVGRGGQCILRKRADAFHVFIYAPWPEKVERVRRRAGAGADVEALIHTTDAERATYIRRYFGQDWKDCHLYDLMISSGPGEAAVVSTIRSLIGVRLDEPGASPYSRAAR